MEQKNYKLEIINVLLKEKSHIRKIANKLNINHMMIVRKIKHLSNENVVDFTKQGKNQVYFLKKTVESRAYVFIAETSNLIKTISKYSELRSIVEKIQKDKRIKLALLFGSYAKGIAKKESDIDIFIETENNNIKKEFNLIDSRLSIKIGKYSMKNDLIKEIDKDHVVIKGVEYYYEKNQFFEKDI
ncbi:MAG: nucleotidyltransferase domain-containing protein [Candidatus Nanoarchaeia archaeon]|nr:nucleotidyltransferase domain-containing protein [Candidatus Nanoarchaeia archaeon]